MILYFVPKCPKALIHYVSLPRFGAADRGTPVHCKNTFVFNSLHYSTWQTLCKAALYQILSAPNHGKALKSAQQMTAGPVKARTFPAGNVSLRSKAAPSRGNQFPLDTRLRRDTPAAGKTTVPEPRLPQQVTRGPVKARTFPAGNVSLRSKAAPSRGNQFPLDTRLRRDTPAAGKTTVPEPRLPQQVTRGPVKARTFPAGNVSLRSKAAPSRGNQFPLDTRLRRDTPSALRGGPKPTVT